MGQIQQGVDVLANVPASIAVPGGGLRFVRCCPVYAATASSGRASGTASASKVGLAKT